MFTQILLLLTFIDLFIDETQGQIGDPCHLIHISKSSEPDLQYLGIPEADSFNLVIPQQCLNGDVNWHSPVGSLLLTTNRYNGGYNLCVEEAWGFNIGELRDVTGSDDIVLPFPTVDKPSCIRDLYGGTKLLITANSTAMISFNYKINYIY